jgi:P-type E1-E2 ATPase
LPEAAQVREIPGQGIEGVVDGAVIRVGSLSWISTASAPASDALRQLAATSDGLRAFVATETQALGMIQFADTMRTGLREFFDRLRRLGITRTLLLSGDHAGNVANVAREIGITEFRGDLLPQDKVSVVRELRDGGAQVAMIGDGTNDAPALATATVGIALAGHGGGITAEAADVVLLVDDVSRVADAIAASQHAMRIARQSITVGLGLSALGMLWAASGHLVPWAGALVQEGIDVAVIVNALRASRPSPG